jgi:DNA-binding Xre family transcriptional regulator
MNKNNIGSTFDSWLREEGIYDEASSAAIKRVLTRQVEAAMAEQNISKAEMAKRMQTSRAALNRLLDPSHDAVALSTLQKAAIALGRQIRLELIYRAPTAVPAGSLGRAPGSGGIRATQKRGPLRIGSCALRC